MSFSQKRTISILVAIILIAACFRFYGLNWDGGYNLHPDEITLYDAVAILHIPHTIAEFFSPSSSWNPHRFAYGSFPIYLLYILTAGISTIGSIVGRSISGVSDLGTILIIFLIGKKIVSTKIGLWAAGLYSLSVLPIQLSHFATVDILLNFLMLLTVYFMLRFYEKPSILYSLLLGLSFGLALATKTSAILLAIPLIFTFFLSFYSKKVSSISSFIKYVVFICSSIIISFAIFEPYAFIDFDSFYKQSMHESTMTYDTFAFPFTYQFFNNIPYYYELKHIFHYGLGPLFASIAFLGIWYFAVSIWKKKKSFQKRLIIFIYFICYFLVVGSFSIGFMRYMLPIYPLLAIFAAIAIDQINTLFFKQLPDKKALYVIEILIFFIWPITFMQIYTKPNTRVDASVWINQHIPAKKTIVIEQGDNKLPLFGQKKYTVYTLPLYLPESDQKWAVIQYELQKADYIIIASSRLYKPLQRLTNCSELPLDKCYQQTAQYYQSLFNGSLGFQKVAEFSSEPTIPLIDYQIDDQAADESFYVFDHPKVMIYQKLPRLQY